MRKIKLFMLLLLISGSSYAQHQVTGRVTAGDTGEPIPYASVVLKGETRYTTTTGDDGSYSISLPSGEGTLIASFVGYQNLEVAVNGRSIIDFTLELDATTLDEAMVVAYGVVSRDRYSGSASTVKSDKIKDIPVVSFEEALAGNTSGVQISQTSGLPGTFPEIRIRGLSSINAGNDPLYVIDGVPAISGDHSTANTWTSAMNFLNPSDIENVTVLKDAAAAALYGSRAANGVILITTKKGRVGKTQFTLKSSVGFSDFAYKSFETVGEEDAEMLTREMLYNTAKYQLNYNDTQIENYVNTRIGNYYPERKPGYGYIDWLDAVTQTAINHNHELTISGGSDNTKFFLSGGYTKAESVTIGRYMERFSGTLNFEHKLNKYLKAGATVQFSHTEQEGNQENANRDNPWYNAVVKHTARWPAYNPDGSYYTDPYTPIWTDLLRNTLLNNETQITNSIQKRTILKPWVELKIIDGLTAKSIFSYDWLHIYDQFAWLKGHAHARAYSGANEGDGFYTRKNHNIEKIVSSTTLNYTKTFNDKHNLSVLAGWEAESEVRDHVTVGKVGLVSANVVSSNLGARVLDADGYKDETAILSFISSANYDYKSKYFASASYRRDGSSRMAPDKRWGDFWSVSGSWRISQESFLQNVSWLNDLRIRASYGVSGTLPSSWYVYMSMYSSSLYGNTSTLYPSAVSNPNLVWEKNHTGNIAIETRLFDRVRLSADFYQKRTKDLLMSGTLAQITGFSSSLRNIGEMENKGVEIEVNVDILNKQDLKLSAGLTWTTNKNELTKMSYEGEEIISLPYIRKEGYSYYQYRLREYVGVDPQTGQALYAKNSKNADGSYDKTPVTAVSGTNGAQYIIIDGKTGDPKGYGGLTTNLTYKNLSLAMVFSYKYGQWVYNESGSTLEGDGYSTTNNISVNQLARWQKPGDITDVPRREMSSTGGAYTSTRHLHRGDYIRLKSLTVSYRLPQKWVEKIMLQSARVYASGTNLFTITGLDFDPELARNNGYVYFMTPPVRTISFGLELNF